MRSRLEQAGIPCHSPAETMKMLDPFETGGMIFDYEVLVPQSALALARGQLADASVEAEPRADEQELPADFFEADSVDPIQQVDVARARELSQRIRWGAISWVGAPVSLWSFPAYREVVKRLEAPPPQHVATICAFGLALAQVAGLALAFSPWR